MGRQVCLTMPSIPYLVCLTASQPDFIALHETPKVR